MFQSFHIGQKLGGELVVPFDKTKDHPITLTTKKHKLLNVSSGSKDATYHAILKGQISQHLPLLKMSCLGVREKNTFVQRDKGYGDF